MQDTFYKIGKNKIALVNESRKLSFRNFVDELDCSKSFARKNTDKTFEEILELYKKDSGFKHITFVVRNNDPIKSIEVGIRVTGENSIDYFIFIYVDLKYLDYFIKKYKLSLHI